MKLIMEKIDRQPNYDNNSAKANDIFARILVHFGNLQTLTGSRIGYI
jgi:hypothetical protein